MSGISGAEARILEIMYEGDKRRDAASKIRGFLLSPPGYAVVKQTV